MHIPSKHVFEALESEGITEIHHANSVATSCLFLRSEALLSRGTIERRGLKQTPQSSDALDKKYSIWFDVFADTVDIHHRAKRANSYGPVTFVLDAELIKNTNTGRVWVTKLNPTKWAGKTEKQRWFQGKADLKESLVRGQFDQMLVFRHCGGELPFRSFLKEIILDDPEMQSEEGIDLYSMAVGALRLAMAGSDIDLPITRRKCSFSCSCVEDYESNHDRTFMMFDPKARLSPRVET